MDPFTILALASIAVQGVSLIYNYFAGQSALDQKGARLEKQQGFAKQSNSLANSQIADSLNSATADIGMNRDLAIRTLNHDNAAAAANIQDQKQMLQGQMAQNGIMGPMGEIASQGKADVARGNLDLKTGDQRYAVDQRASQAENTANSQYQFAKANQDLRFAQQNDSFANDSADIQSQRDQLNMDTLMNGIGVGISAFSALTPVKLPAAKTGNGYNFADQTAALKYHAKGGKGGYAY